MFSISTFVRLSLLAAGAVAATGLASARTQSTPSPPSATFYTVMGELALTHHDPLVAAQEYAKAAQANPEYLPRAVEVAAETLQPSIGLSLAERWAQVDPKSLDARRAAAEAALSLHHIDRAVASDRYLLDNSPHGVELEFAAIDKGLRAADNVYGARQVADRLGTLYPQSAAAQRMRGYADLRGEDPAAAVHSFDRAMALAPAAAQDQTTHDLVQAARRARILAGDVDAPLAEALAEVERDDTVINRFDYVLLLVAARREPQALDELNELRRRPEAGPDALRIAGLLEYQAGNYDEAGQLFTDLLGTGHDIDDAFFYLGLIAERHDDLERALSCYSRVQNGDNAMPALLRAAAILHAHGEAKAADELLKQLVIDQPDQAPEILAARANIYGRGGDLAGAQAVLDAAIQQYPDNVGLRYARATNLEDQGRIDAALRELTAIDKARPEDPAAWNALGYTLADHSQQLPRARALIERAYAFAPKSAAIQDSLGWVLFRQGHAEQALPYLQDAFAEEPGGDIGAHLGEVLWTLGRRDEAERAWSDAGKVDIDSRLLKSTKQRLHLAQ